MSERASEREAVVRYLRAMAQTYRDDDTNADDVMPVAAEIDMMARRVADEEHAEFRSEREGDFELIDGLVLARLLDERDALRAILAPLLEHPMVDGKVGVVCILCGTLAKPVDPLRPYDPSTVIHVGDCPYLRRDALLGREAPT